MIGWLGSILLAFCGLPELMRTVKDKHCYVGWGMLLMWFFGELLIFIHVALDIKDVALLTNYFVNLVIISIMLYYKIFKRNLILKL